MLLRKEAFLGVHFHKDGKGALPPPPNTQSSEPFLCLARCHPVLKTARSDRQGGARRAGDEAARYLCAAHCPLSPYSDAGSCPRRAASSSQREGAAGFGPKRRGQETKGELSTAAGGTAPGGRGGSLAGRSILGRLQTVPDGCEACVPSPASPPCPSLPWITAEVFPVGPQNPSGLRAGQPTPRSWSCRAQSHPAATALGRSIHF